MKVTSTGVVALSLALLCPVLCPSAAFAQWDNRQDIIWNQVESRMDIRRTRERMRRNRGKGKKSSASASRRGRRSGSAKVTKVARRAAPAKLVAPLPPHSILFTRDSWQDFHIMDGYRVDLSFASPSGKTITKSVLYDYYRFEVEVEGVPAGTYTVRAVAAYKGKKYPAHVGTQEGSEGDPKGGDFAPSVKIVLKPIIDQGGSRVMGISPGKLYVPVLE